MHSPQWVAVFLRKRSRFRENLDGSGFCVRRRSPILKVTKKYGNWQYPSIGADNQLKNPMSDGAALCPASPGSIAVVER